ncbi:MAG: ABC transporter permease [Firmicutes bacterium]|nr:ABC transporter permease [Bacillota bacterium]
MSLGSVFNLTLLHQSIVQATPLLLTALGGVFSERSGTVNIALEGIIMIGAFFGYAGTYYTGNPWIGVIWAMVAGLLVSLIHAIVTTTYKVDHIVSGIALNLLAQGLTGYLLVALFQSQGSAREFVAQLPTITIPFLKAIPVIGPVLNAVFSQGPLVYLAFLLVLVGWFLLERTVFGLRFTSVGEAPQVADSLGVRVEPIQYAGVLISGLLAGAAGAQLTIGTMPRFVYLMSGGRGYIALAAVILGKWKPVGVMWSSLLFGFFFSLADNLQGTGFAIPNEIFLMLPFILTIVVVSGLIGHTEGPAHSGKPYIKEL